jgi:hypothetical protein
MFIALFLVICLVVSVGYSAYRYDAPGEILRETAFFFCYMTLGICAFAGVIYLLTVI